jgi:hypothetical protein
MEKNNAASIPPLTAPAPLTDYVLMPKRLTDVGRVQGIGASHLPGMRRIR